MRGWLYFAFVQLVALIAMVIGWFLLIVPCACGAWKQAVAPYTPNWYTGQPRTINIWSWGWLNKIWGNDEDGVTETNWYNTGDSRWRSYLWSAWRNSANNLRFVFRNFNGPFYKIEYKGWYFQCGWYPNGFPVLSAGRV